MGRVLIRANETSCWQAKSRPLTKNPNWLAYPPGLPLCLSLSLSELFQTMQLELIILLAGGCKNSWERGSDEVIFYSLITFTDANGLVKLWHASSSKCVHTIHETRQTLTASFAKDSSLFITAGSDEKIYVYDSTTRKLVNTCQPR